MAFLTIVAATYIASALTGQVVFEKARRESLWAQERAREALQQESLLRRQIDALTSLTSIEAWARENGFVAPDRQPWPSQRVTRVAARIE